MMSITFKTPAFSRTVGSITTEEEFDWAIKDFKKDVVFGE